MARISSDASKDIVKRLNDLKELNFNVTGDGSTANESLRFKINELYLQHKVIELRNSLELLKQLKTDLARFEDLCRVDYHAFWKLYESDFCEISASDIVELKDDLQISLILRFYMQALINKAIKLVAPERLGELVFI